DEEDAQADITRSPQAKRLHTTEGRLPSNESFCELVEAITIISHDGSRNHDHSKVEQHATTADESQPLEEAPNLAAEEQYVSPADASLPQERSLNLAIDERRNQREENPLGALTTRDYDDPLTRSDLQNYLRSLRGNFELDRQYMQAYNSQFLSRCDIAPEFRECLVQWMIQVHMWMAIPVRTLHVAVGLMDLYTWLRPILPQEYQLLALGAIKLATRIREPGVTMSDLALCKSAAAAYTPAQLAKMEANLEECVGNRINFPTPYTFLEHYIIGLSDFSPANHIATAPVTTVFLKDYYTISAHISGTMADGEAPFYSNSRKDEGALDVTQVSLNPSMTCLQNDHSLLLVTKYADGMASNGT
ncbi:unnamed protein product, partial [Taenia asiatica]|uniref:Cyclin N-terminal domain-containing protein n=1 Tax=Taenia asiatica TaxID=60517 RepID=A0A0R3VWW9_TAEAS